MHDDNNKQKWKILYLSALTELQHSLMAGRIREARTAILDRIEKLREIPGLHSEERQAIQDALSSLRFLEREDVQRTAEIERQAAQEALEKLKSLAPRLE